MAPPCERLTRSLGHVGGGRTKRMQALVDALCSALYHTSVSRIGFYPHEGRDEQ